MNHQKVMAMLNELNIPFAYNHFAEGESPKAPFICFLYPRSDNFGADNMVYHSRTRLHLELYTDYKNPKLEARIEKVLDSRELFYNKSETWIPSEKLYEVLYSMTI